MFVEGIRKVLCEQPTNVIYIRKHSKTLTTSIKLVQLLCPEGVYYATRGRVSSLSTWVDDIGLEK